MEAAVTSVRNRILADNPTESAESEETPLGTLERGSHIPSGQLSKPEQEHFGESPFLRIDDVYLHRQLGHLHKLFKVGKFSVTSLGHSSQS